MQARERENVACLFRPTHHSPSTPHGLRTHSPPPPTHTREAERGALYWASVSRQAM